MKKNTLVGHPLGPETLVILVGTFRSAAMWAVSQGLHLNQWTLIESCTPLIVFNRQGDRPSGQAQEERGTLVVGIGMKRRTRWWPSTRWRGGSRTRLLSPPGLERRGGWSTGKSGDE